MQNVTLVVLFFTTALVLLGSLNFAQAIQAGSTTDPQNPNPHPSNPFDGAAIVNIPAVTIEACDPESSCPPLLKQIDFSGFPIPAFPADGIVIHEEFIVGQGSPEWWDWHERVTDVVLENVFFTGSASISKVAAGAPCDVGTSTIFDFDADREIWFDFEGNIGGLNFGDKLCVWKDVSTASPTSRPFTGILEIEEWPTIHKKMAVGGEMFPVDTTSLLLAATYSTSAWLIPLLVTAVGFGIIITKQKTKLKNNSCPSCKLESDDIFELGENVVGKCDTPRCRVSLFFCQKIS